MRRGSEKKKKRVEVSKAEMEKKKRQQHKEHGAEQSSHYGNVHIQGEGPVQASEQERKKDQEPFTRKKRKGDKTGAHSKQATAVTKEIACTADCVRNDGHQHVINGVMEQKTRRNMGDFSLHHDIGMCTQTREKKKKKKKKRDDNQGEHDPFCPDHAKAPMHLSDEDDMLFNLSTQPDDPFCPDRAKAPVHLSDEDDMLFNFSTQPGATVIDDHRKPQANIDRREQKTEILLAGDEILKSKKKKKRKMDEGEHNSDHYKDSTPCTEENDGVFNFVTQPQPAVENTIDYKSPTMATNQHANGSFREEKKLQNNAFIEQKHLKVKEKKEMTVVDIRTGGTPEKNTSSRKSSSESPSRPTFSIAVAGSIVDNAQSLELATMLAGQIARAATIFRVDEIIVFDDYDGESTFNHQAALQEDNSEEVGGLFMVRILEYLEVPQYLRRALIPMHRSLSSVGKLPPLDAPHHLRKHEWRPFREGVVLDNGPLSGSGSCVDVGLEKDVVVGQNLKPGMRVTVAMGHTRADGS